VRGEVVTRELDLRLREITRMVVMEELGTMCDGEIVGFSPTSEIDDGGAQHTRVFGRSHEWL
jgi:hypothetical protein